MIATEWANLPNAAHIDRVIASVKANPDHWRGSWSAQDETWNAPRNAPRAEAWNAARGMVLVQVRDAAWNAAWNAAWAAQPAGRGKAGQAARDALLALIAYDDCAHMLDSDPSEIAILAALGDLRAALLLPACKVFHSSKTVVTSHYAAKKLPTNYL